MIRTDEGQPHTGITHHACSTHIVPPPLLSSLHVYEQAVCNISNIRHAYRHLFDTISIANTTHLLYIATHACSVRTHTGICNVQYLSEGNIQH